MILQAAVTRIAVLAYVRLRDPNLVTMPAMQCPGTALKKRRKHRNGDLLGCRSRFLCLDDAGMARSSATLTCACTLRKVAFHLLSIDRPGDGPKTQTTVDEMMTADHEARRMCQSCPTPEKMRPGTS